MSALNEPTEGYTHKDDWTPEGGVARAAAWGLLTAAIILLISAPLAWFLPRMLLHWLLRGAFAFALCWLLLNVTQRKGGFAGVPITALAVGFTILVLLSHHLVFALHGVLTTRGVFVGWAWLHPATLGVINLVPMIGIVAAVLLGHRGATGIDALVDVCRFRLLR